MLHREYIGKLPVTDSLKERIGRINGQLKEHQVSLALDFDSEGNGLLMVEYYKKQKNERNAGRKRLDVSGSTSSLWRLSDIKASMKEIGCEETARLLGCSRATLYRRVKELEGKDTDLFY